MSGQDFSDLAQAIGLEVDDSPSKWVDEEEQIDDRELGAPVG